MTNLRIELLRQVSNICDEFEALLVDGKPPVIEDWLDLVSDIARDELFSELLRLELSYHPNSEDTVSLEQLGLYLKRFPDNSSSVVKAFAQLRAADNEQFCDFDASPPEATMPVVEPGDLVGAYRLNSVLGSGGFSTVFAATDLEFQRPVAIKLLRQNSRATHAKTVESFIVEAAALSKLDHKAIPKIYAIGEDPLAGPYVVMEFVKGESLQSIIESKRFSLEELLLLLAKTAEALGYIHECGFYHRDLKPANIVVGFDGEPRIVDFGLAIHESRQLECGSERVGTRAFMSPEQMLGDSSRLDGRTDVWSLGVILYFIVAGRLPFRLDASIQESVEEVFDRPVKPPRQIKENNATIAIEAICFRALEKDPKQRYSTAYDFANDLRSAVDGLAEELLLEHSGIDESLSHRELTLIMLARQAKVWTEQPDVGHLPGFSRYARFNLYSRRDLWSETESRMMRSAGKRLVINAGLVAIVLAVIGFLLFQIFRQNQQSSLRNLVDQIGVAEFCENETLIERLREIDEGSSDRLLHEAYLKSQRQGDVDKQIRFGMSNSSRYPELAAIIERRLLDARLDEISALSRAGASSAGASSQLRVLSEQQQSELRSVIASHPAALGSHVLWPAPDGSACAKIIQSGGHVAREWAYCARMPIETFRQVCDTLRESNYRPVCIRPYRRKGRTYVAGLWNRDAIDWKVEYGLTRDQLAAEIKKQEANGLFLSDASDGLVSPANGANFYVALWSTQNDQVAQARRLGIAQQIFGTAENDRNANRFLVVEKDFETDLLASVPGIVEIRMQRSTGSSESEALLQQRNRLTHAMSPSNLKTAARFKSGQQATLIRDVRERQFQLDAIERFVATAMKSAGFGNSKFGSSKFGNSKFGNSKFGNSIFSIFESEIQYLRSSNVTLAAAELLNKTKCGLRPQSKVEVAESCLRLAHEVGVNLLSQDQIVLLESRAVELYRTAIESDATWQGGLLRSEHLWRHSDNEMFQSLVAGCSRELISGVWAREHASFQSKFVPPHSLASHLQHAVEMGKAGWRPVSISSLILEDRQSFASVWHRPVWTAADDQRLQKTVNAVCLAWKHQIDLGVAALLSDEAKPELRNRMIQALVEFEVSGDRIVELLDDPKSRDSQFALLVVLGSLAENSFSQSTQRHLKDLLARFSQNADAGIRAAAKWTASRRGFSDQSLPLSIAFKRQPFPANWVEHCDGQTLIQLKRSSIVNGELAFAAEEVVNFLASKPVSWDDFSDFDPTVKQPETETERERGEHSRVASVTFSRAAGFCNWMSQKDGIDRAQWCYSEDENGVFHPKSNIAELGGCRLPCRSQLAIAASERQNKLWLAAAPSQSRHAKRIEERVAEQPNFDGFFGLAAGYREWVHPDSRLPVTGQLNLTTGKLSNSERANGVLANGVLTKASFRICRPGIQQPSSNLASKHHRR